MYGSMEQSTPAEAPALGPAELVAAAANKLCRGEHGRLPRERWCCPVPLTVRGTQALVSFAPLAFKLFYAARQNAVLRRSPFPPP